LGKYCGDSFDMTEYRQNLLFRFAEKRANELIKNHGLLEKGWTFKWNKNKRSFGICRYQQKRIELSAILTVHQTVDQVEDTLIHEIAHALTPGNGHGTQWKAVASKLGARPERVGYLSDKGQKEMEKHAPWALVYKNNVIKTFYKKPTRTIRKLPFMWLTGRKEETYGKLEVVPNPQYKKKV
jgi:hypothetical protein